MAQIVRWQETRQLSAWVPWETNSALSSGRGPGLGGPARKCRRGNERPRGLAERLPPRFCFCSPAVSPLRRERVSAAPQGPTLQQSKQTFGTDPVHCKHDCKQYKSFDPERLLRVNVSVPGSRRVGPRACRHVSAGVRALTHTQWCSPFLHTDQCKCHIRAISEQGFAKNTSSQLQAESKSSISHSTLFLTLLLSSFVALTACQHIHPVGPPSIQLHPQDKCLSRSPPAPRGLCCQLKWSFLNPKKRHLPQAQCILLGICSLMVSSNVQ